MYITRIADVQNVHLMYGCTPPGRVALPYPLKYSVVKVKLLISLGFLFCGGISLRYETYSGGVYIR